MPRSVPTIDSSKIFIATDLSVSTDEYVKNHNVASLINMDGLFVIKSLLRKIPLDPHPHLGESPPMSPG